MEDSADVRPGAPARRSPGGFQPGPRFRTAVVLLEISLVVALLLVWLLSDQVRHGWSLWLFFLYSFPAEFLVPVVPHEVPLIHLATRHDPLLLALIAGTGTVLTEVLNYHVVRHLSDSAGIRPDPSNRAARRLVELFGRAPFLALWVAGATPVIPFFPLRFLAVASGYPLWRYLLAGAASRTPRFYLTALLGKALMIPVPWVIALFVVLTAVVVPGNIHRWLMPGGSRG